MTDIKPAPKKSVALSGVIAGDTALCTVGRTGNDLHYRGYDILDVAETCEFEEIAYLLVHGSLPTLSELQKLQGQAEGAARVAARRVADAGIAARRRASDGCPAEAASPRSAASCRKPMITTSPARATLPTG